MSSPARAPQPKVPLTRLYQRTSRRTGETFLVGRVGALKLFVCETQEESKGDRVWVAYLAEAHSGDPIKSAPDDVE